MKKTTLFTAILAASLSTSALAQRNATPIVSAEMFRGHVTFLADDLLEGREAGTRGYDLAARYVATQLAGLGVTPAVNGSWYQDVPLAVATETGTPRFSIGGQDFRVGEHVLFSALYQAAPLTVDAPLVFVGYGLDGTGDMPDSYAGVDVRGKVVVVYSGLPQGTRSDVAAHLNSDRRRIAAQKGAIGMITISAPNDPLAARAIAAARTAGPRRTTTWVGADGRGGRATDQLQFAAIVVGPAAEALFAGAPQTLQAVTAAAAANQPLRSFALRPRVAAARQTENRRFTSANVIGMIPGSDPALANEYVILTAHLDHIGISPEGAPGADRINNGAMDNATGIATLIEVARLFMQPGNRPKRPILLAAVTAEEKGLLGASYLARNPVNPGRLIANVNLDMPVLTYAFQDVIAFGAEHSTLGEAVARAASGMNVGTIPDPLPEQGLFTRSDHYNFVLAGVPSVFLMTGFGGEGAQRFRSFLSTEYHSPADEIDLPFNWQAGARFAELNYRIAREIADAAQAPRWYRGSYFGEAFGGNQPRAPQASGGRAASR